MYTFISCILVGCLFWSNNCIASDNDKCLLGSEGATLVKLNHIYKEAAGKYLDHGCFDPKKKFPIDSLVVDKSFPLASAKTVLDLFKACAKKTYDEATKNGDDVELPAIKVFASQFMNHILVVCMQKLGLMDDLPESDTDSDDSIDTDVHSTSRFHTTFTTVDKRVAYLTNLDAEERQKLWQTLGFYPQISMEPLNSLILPLFDHDFDTSQRQPNSNSCGCGCSVQ